MATKEQRDAAVDRATQQVLKDCSGFITRAGTWRPKSESAPGPLERRDEKTEG